MSHHLLDLALPRRSLSVAPPSPLPARPFSPPTGPHAVLIHGLRDMIIHTEYTGPQLRPAFFLIYYISGLSPNLDPSDCQRQPFLGPRPPALIDLFFLGMTEQLILQSLQQRQTLDL